MKRKALILLEIHPEMYTDAIIFEIAKVSEIIQNNPGIGKVRNKIDHKLIIAEAIGFIPLPSVVHMYTHVFYTFHKM